MAWHVPLLLLAATLQCVRCVSSAVGAVATDCCVQESLGDPILSVELCVGDVLYMPRGTVHQAVADVDANSDHLTISTYQRASFADLATHLLQVGAARVRRLDKQQAATAA